MRPPKDSVAEATQERGWRPGPLPEGTYYWGGVVLKGDGRGFRFADFCGSHVIYMADFGYERAEADQVVWYDNGLTEPPDPVTSKRG